jgi:flagellar biosynthesis protein FlhF
MKDALALIRHELGSEAVILESREIPGRRRLLPWLKTPAEVVVTAGSGESVTTHNSGGVALKTDNETTISSDISLEDLSVPVSPTQPSDAQDLSGESESPVAKAVQIAAELERRGESPIPPRPTVDQAAGLVASIAAEISQTSPSIRTTASPTLPSGEVVSRLNTLQRMVENLSRTPQFQGGEEIPSELFEIYTQLIDADMEDEIARELVFALRQAGTPEQIEDADASHALLSAMVETDIRCTSPIQTQPDQRNVVALVGPTGVGKTTTIAKLAANFRLRDGVKMGLVTVDTYRIAAVEQLRTYAEIIDLPMKVVTSPAEIRQALDDFAGLDLVLIDTAGRSPRDEPQIQELKSILEAADVDEVHVVMSLTASVRSIRMTCEQFQAVNPTALILTKLDEAAGMGSLLSVSKQVSLPVSYLTTGQDVPEDIEPADAGRMTRLILGQDRLFD